MSPDRFDVLERFEPLFEAPEPSFERFERRRDRRRRNQRIAAGIVGVSVFVAAIWVVTSGSPVDRSITPGVTGPSDVSGEPAPVGLVGLPPADAAPSLPERGDLVFGFVFGHSSGDPGRFGVHVYEDGRVIRQRLGDVPGGVDYLDEPTGLVEQRLTPEGVELLVSEVRSTDLVDHDLHLTGLYGLRFGWIEFVDGDRTVDVTWGDDGLDDVERTAPTQEQADALERLDVRLGNLASWLPASAWEDQEPEPFVPSRYSVCYETLQHGAGLEATLDSLPPAAADFLRPLDRTHQRIRPAAPFGTSLDYWCSTVTTDQVRALAQILDDAGIPSNGGDVFGVEYRTSDREPVRVQVSFGPVLPHEG
jgi:hypothetical protein